MSETVVAVNSGVDISELQAFLGCVTPQAWLDEALQQQDVLLIDHAHCEKKAASSALNLIFHYPRYPELLQKMSRLAREELLHFEKVLKILKRRNITYNHLSPSHYAAGLRQHVRTFEPQRLVDLLIIGAFIEARSCERFAKIAPYLDEELQRFYLSLLKSEARHYQDYLSLAELYSPEPITQRVAYFRDAEAALIQAPDKRFRFHSGLPQT
ncbi:MAG: tRNA-(ms[2]io[6]A)-hydroxylase [Legionellales bacterium]|nr:tRNA-(ms[2]io[6]A)-hydroxylase [Legionellales bacterium]|tara:strand:- start:13504 stop:14139 length:636 start_codon:yes stop_codon:yes gene_type:complete